MKNFARASFNFHSCCQICYYLLKCFFLKIINFLDFIDIMNLINKNMAYAHTYRYLIHITYTENE